MVDEGMCVARGELSITGPIAARRLARRAGARDRDEIVALLIGRCLGRLGSRRAHALEPARAAQGATIVMPSQISFDDTPVQTAVSRTFTVRNDGDIAARVGIPPPDGEISVQLGADGGPVTVEPGGSVTGEARYLPTNLGPDRALPSIDIAGPTCGEQPVLMSLSGQGVCATPGHQQRTAPLHLTCAEYATSGALQLAPSELTIPAGGTDAFTVTMVAGPNATGLLQRDIRCRTNQLLHEIRDTTMTLTVVPAE